MADTNTTNLNLTKPEVGASSDTWGGKINTNLDTLDGLFSAGPALKVANGGTGAVTQAAARTNLGVGTGNSPQFASVNIGDAADTEITREAAGVIAVDGKIIAVSGTSESLLIGTVELGHETDTSITRSSAGVIAVEGKIVTLEGRSNTFTSNQIISVTDNTNAALRVTQLGSGHAILVEDETNPDSTPYIVDASGRVGVGGAPAAGNSVRVARDTTGAASASAVLVNSTIRSDVTTQASAFKSNIDTEAASFTLSALQHFEAAQGNIGAASVVTSQYGFLANSSLTGASNNYGFYGNLASASGRWNYYAAGTAPNYFAGDVRSNTVVMQAASPTNSNTSVTLTAANLLSGLITGTPTATCTFTLPTGTNTDAAFQDLQTNQAFEWSVINLSPSYTITVAAGTGHTVVGNMVVAVSSSTRFLTRKTAANTFVTYKIA